VRLGPRRWIALLFVLALARPAGAAELRWRGLLDITGAELVPAAALNALTRGDNPFDLYRTRLFVESQVDDRVQVLAQIVMADASGLYVDGAYAVFTPWAERDLHLMAGKLPWAVGTWGPRTYSDKNPLVSAPLIYQHHTSLLWYDLPANADVLLAAAGSGQSGVNYGFYTAGVGMPIVDDSYWDVGATLAGSARPLEYAVGVVAGAPGWGSTMQDDNAGKSVLGRVGVAPSPMVRAGLSGSWGPYLHRDVESSLPPGTDVDDYAQQLVMADLELQVGHAELRAEGAYNVWETPTVGDLVSRSGYAELKYRLPNGAYLAGRFDVLRHEAIADSTGAGAPWDADVTRLELGAGYRLSRAATAKLVWQHTTLDFGRPGWRERRWPMLAAQLSVGF
jgi:hypothetical protein